MAASPLGPGTVLARRFTLDDLLDDHDGARLWRATDRTLARSVAVHLLPDTDARADALLTAARTSALVSDGHLLRVLDAAAENGVVYVVNEWGAGVSLDRLVAEGPLSPRRAAWVVKEVAEAITTAHRNGVAHGRLLPENVMISEAGSVKLIGFVIDAVLRSETGTGTGTGQVRVTGGEPISAHESDVVNLGALLYAALVGRWPGTTGSTIPQAPAEHGRPLRPRQVRAGVPRPLDAICERVLNAEGHPHMLPIETAHEIYAALSDFIGDTGAAAIGDGHHGSPASEPTALLQRGDLPEAGSPTTTADAVDGSADDEHDDTSDLLATGAYPAAGTVNGTVPGSAGPGADPEATQAGVPMFLGDGTGVGWRSGADSRSLYDDGSTDDDGKTPRSRSTAPPPPAVPERPLFAEGPSAAAAAAAGSATSTGSRDDDTGGASFLGSSGRTSNSAGGSWSTGGAGSVPAKWGPDADEPSHGEEWPEDGHDEVPGRSWLRLAVVLAVLTLVVVVALFAFNVVGRTPAESPTATPSSHGSSSAASSPPSSEPVPISGVSDFDPQGDPPEENPDLAPLAVDGKPGTAWQTLTYRGNPKLGGLKSGVGLLVDLGRRIQVGEVRLALPGQPTSLDVLAAPDAQSKPTGTDGLSTVATKQGAGPSVDLRLKKPVTTQYLVVWLTSLPAAPGGFKGQIAEITLRS